MYYNSVTITTSINMNVNGFDGYQNFFIDASSGNITINMLNIYANGLSYIFNRADSSGNTVTLAAAAGQTVMGSATTTMPIGAIFTLVSSGTDWSRLNPLTSFNGRYGTVVSAEGDYTLTQLADVTITSPATNQILRHNGTGWANAANINSFAGRTGAVVPASGDYNITQLAGVSITSPTNGQTLVYNGTNWANSSSGGGGVTSFKGRTGAVNPEHNDYNLDQLSDVSIAPIPMSGSVLTYDGFGWSDYLNTKCVYFNSQGNLTNNLYFRGGGTGTLVQGSHVLSNYCRCTGITGSITASNSGSVGWRFTLYKNGATTGVSVSMLGSTTNAYTQADISFQRYDRYQILISSVNGTPTAATGMVTLDFEQYDF